MMSNRIYSVTGMIGEKQKIAPNDEKIELNNAIRFNG